MRGNFVALRKESVDRNFCLKLLLQLMMLPSLSARRAWIEMYLEESESEPQNVALRKESVDRNDAMQVIVIVMDTVALRKESVDRNNVQKVIGGIRP